VLQQRLSRALSTFILIATVLGASGSIVAFAYTTFQTKDESSRVWNILEKRLERIEDKVDELLRRGVR
jgi:hypothetical protein